MKSTRPARPILGQAAGYGGAVLLVVVAVVVLLRPLVDEGKDGTGAAGPQGAAGPGAAVPTGQQVAPGVSVPPVDPIGPVPRRTKSGQPDPGGPQGGGPQMPGQNGSGTGATWCPQGTAYWRVATKGVDVVITVSASGAVRAEVTVQGHAPQARQATVRGGAPHAFHFTDIPPHLVQRVKITTVSVGVTMQTCYARVA
ncbi:hypothetical protein [Actinomadura rubrisoli]|uniref:Uncharacterized protein n=1 Tax=Actinomadura rubrisoli TaxID=2530368 RepID=A0A4R5B117_9ACTN|nr:hypothetical protein [Actinomadura rubrisoli]TDD79708.1 hypothetical protein E1298_27220 [Actinomadura rubrisoli]